MWQHGINDSKTNSAMQSIARQQALCDSIGRALTPAGRRLAQQQAPPSCPALCCPCALALPPASPRCLQQCTHLSMRFTAIWMHSLASSRSDSAHGLAAAQRRISSNPSTSVDRLRQHEHGSTTSHSRRNGCQHCNTRSDAKGAKSGGSRAAAAGGGGGGSDGSGGLARLLSAHSSRPCARAPRLSCLPAMAWALAWPERLRLEAHRWLPARSPVDADTLLKTKDSCLPPLRHSGAWKGTAPSARAQI